MPLSADVVPSDAAPALCAVICCYTTERYELLTRAVAAARDQLTARDRLVVVVDHNDELLADLREHHASSTVVVVPSTGERGLSGARNTGLAHAAEDIVVFLDDDAILVPGALDAVRTAMADPEVACIGGSVTARWAATGGTENGHPPRWFPDEFGWVVGCDYRGMPVSGSTIRNPIGAAMAVRRDALVKIGGFDAALGRVGTLPVGCEETLMGIELRRVFPGSRTVRHTPFGVWHHVPASRGTLRYFASRCYHEGRSKAVLTEITGAGNALEAEIGFLLRTITSGVLRYAGQTVRGDVSALARLVMMIVGVAVTVAGTLTGRLSRGGTGASEAQASRSTASPTRAPIGVDDLVSVVIPTVGRDMLRSTVEAILATNHPHVEVIAVDNRPAVGATRRVLADIDDPRLRIIDEPIPGISAARNTGAAAAAGTIIAFTDDDAIPEPDWLSQIVAAFAADVTGTVGVVTGRVLGTDDPTETQAWFEEAGIFDKGTRAQVWTATLRPEYAVLGEIGEHNSFFPYTAGEIGSGNNQAIAAETFHALGGFDERLGVGTPTRGGEDLDMFRRTVLDGWAIVYSPTAVIRHYHRDNISELRWQSYGYGLGMSASLTKLLPSRHSAALLRRIPAGVYTLLAPSSIHNSTLPSDWPRHLRVIEIVGYLVGPIGFMRSHLRMRGAREETRRAAPTP